MTQEFYEKYMEPFGVTSFRKGSRAIDLQIINNHPVTSFPFLAPPNVLYLGNLLGNTAESTSSLPKEYTDFINQCRHPNLIYVSFGSYLWNLTKVEWMEDFLDYLLDVDACIILKATHGVEVARYPKDTFLISKWVPQKSLLASGTLSYFISHCGNNGIFVSRSSVDRFLSRSNVNMSLSRSNVNMFLSRSNVDICSYHVVTLICVCHAVTLTCSCDAVTLICSCR